MITGIILGIKSGGMRVKWANNKFNTWYQLRAVHGNGSRCIVVLLMNSIGIST